MANMTTNPVMVAPARGAWIEMVLHVRRIWFSDVAPARGAWIEIVIVHFCVAIATSRARTGRVD